MWTSTFCANRFMASRIHHEATFSQFMFCKKITCWVKVVVCVDAALLDVLKVAVDFFFFLFYS